jgi:hypothetical protein
VAHRGTIPSVEEAAETAAADAGETDLAGDAFGPVGAAVGFAAGLVVGAAVFGGIELYGNMYQPGSYASSPYGGPSVPNFDCGNSCLLEAWQLEQLELGGSASPSQYLGYGGGGGGYGWFPPPPVCDAACQHAKQVSAAEGDVLAKPHAVPAVTQAQLNVAREKIEAKDKNELAKENFSGLVKDFKSESAKSTDTALSGGGSGGSGPTLPTTPGACEPDGEGGQAACFPDERMTQIFRNVSAEEFDSIASTGRFSTAAGQMEGKWIAAQGEHAEQWGRLLNSGEGVTVETRVPQSVADQLYFNSGKLDGIGSGYYADGENLALINQTMDGIRVRP